MSIPHLFRCPISLDLFTDPVTLSTGQTYDRPSIEKWLADGNSTCPVTMQRLDDDAALVPNRTLRHLIDRWLLLPGGPDHHHPNKKAQAASASASGTASSLASLKQALQSADAGIAAKIEMLKRVRVLSTESDAGQACLVQLGFFQHLLQMLFHTAGAVDEELVEVALDCVLSLSPPTQLESLNILKKESRLASFLLLLERGNPRIKAGLCRLVEMVAAGAAATATASTRELCVILGQTPRVLRVLVSLLQHGQPGEHARASEAAARAMSGICSVDANRAGAVREGAVDGLISYLANSGRGSESRALATLEALVGLEAGRKALIKNSGAIKVLVKCVFRVSSSSSSKDAGGSSNGGGESAVGVLLAACCESGRARAEAVNAGVLMQLLLLLQSQCGAKGKAKARALLKLLRSMWARDPAMAAAAAAANLHNFN